MTDRTLLLELPEDLQERVSRAELTLSAATTLARRGSVVVGDKAPQHFHRGHPLAAQARDLCNAAEHSKRGRVGPACGRCWESAIRADERTST